jgi:hypothetical protein
MALQLLVVTKFSQPLYLHGMYNKPDYYSPNTGVYTHR